VAPHGDAPTDRRPEQAVGELGARAVLIRGRPDTRARSARNLIRVPAHVRTGEERR
jgi:hypothetical protein